MSEIQEVDSKKVPEMELELELQQEGARPLTRMNSMKIGKISAIDDIETRDFYGSSTSDSYRLKSELVSRCLEEVGMGRYAV